MYMYRVLEADGESVLRKTEELKNLILTHRTALNLPKASGICQCIYHFHLNRAGFFPYCSIGFLGANLGNLSARKYEFNARFLINQDINKETVRKCIYI
jgi:hypothetical protein